MALLSADQRERVVAAIQQKAPRLQACAVCGTVSGYMLEDGVVFFTVQDTFARLQLGGRGLPCVALTCKNCGNTVFLNVAVLGLRDLFGLPGGA